MLRLLIVLIFTDSGIGIVNHEIVVTLSIMRIEEAIVYVLAERPGICRGNEEFFGLL